MVHTFRYNYGEKEYYFIFDVESGSLSMADYVAFLCAKHRYGTLEDKEKQDFENFDKAEIAEVFSEFEELEKEGELNSKPLITEFSKNIDSIKALCLHICHDCNMRCKYCFANEGTYNTARDYMTLEVGKKAVDLLIENSGSRHNLEIDFFGGEPLMNFQTVKDIVSYAKAQAKQYNKVFSFTMTTNCLLLNDENIDYLNAEMDNIVLSIDGRESIHNEVRKSVNGKPCYETIKNNALKLRKVRGDKKYYVRGTFTNKNLDFSKDILALNDLGFDQISVEPVVLPDEHPLALKSAHLDSILREYEIFSEEYLKRRNDNSGRWFNFFHFMVDLDHGPCPNKRLTGCGAGTDYLAVTPTGEIYPCHQFAGKDKYKLGDVYNGIARQDIRQTFADINVLNKEHCTDCFAKYYCGGGCIANSVNYTKKLNGQYKLGCDMTKKRLELSLAVAAIEKSKIYP